MWQSTWICFSDEQSVSAQAYIGPEVTAKTIASLYDKSERDTIQLLDIGAGTGLVGEQVILW